MSRTKWLTYTRIAILCFISAANANSDNTSIESNAQEFLQEDQDAYLPVFDRNEPIVDNLSTSRNHHNLGVNEINITTLKRMHAETVVFREGDVYACAVGDLYQATNSGTVPYVEKMHIGIKGKVRPRLGQTVTILPGITRKTVAILPPNIPGYDHIQVTIDTFQPGVVTPVFMMTAPYWCQILQGKMTWVRTMVKCPSNCAVRNTSVVLYDRNVVVPGDCSCDTCGCNTVPQTNHRSTN